MRSTYYIYILVYIYNMCDTRVCKARCSGSTEAFHRALEALLSIEAAIRAEQCAAELSFFLTTVAEEPRNVAPMVTKLLPFFRRALASHVELGVFRSQQEGGAEGVGATDRAGGP